ncbi:hypothetical protein ACFSSC_06280 [Corynebacterium mendelii]|uniref:Uncharacterized protein n=1 Tax=Corynebacterium mendelii TaxID=2765362 RepID=A0A939IYE4_9CORY|nr:hypothetical protein [Corynebacterium mendelii]
MCPTSINPGDPVNDHVVYRADVSPQSAPPTMGVAASILIPASQRTYNEDDPDDAHDHDSRRHP